MNWTIRLADPYLRRVRSDLGRPHAHAYERVGFILARAATGAGGEWLILPHQYQAVADEQYILDRDVGARINGDAIRAAMNAAADRSTCVFHVHEHMGRGQPGFSREDLGSYPKLVAAIQRMGPELPHGAIVLSENSANALVWMPGKLRPSDAGRIVIVGRPMDVISGAEGLYA